MKTYVCNFEVIHTDYCDVQEFQDIEIKGEMYRVLRIFWIGAYDYQVDVVPLNRLSEFVN